MPGTGTPCEEKTRWALRPRTLYPSHTKTRLPYPYFLSFSPELILHDVDCDLNRLGKPKQAHNYDKVHEIQKAVDNQIRTRLEQLARAVVCSNQPPAAVVVTAPMSCRPTGPDHECGGDANRAARMIEGTPI
jgi:hypothetical protein